jgi:branched-chain amino acid transport system ATP-binding protein
MTALLQVDNIEVVYKRAITAVQGVTLSVAERQIVAVLGTNGAGKTIPSAVRTSPGPS